ncbi:hypothetical protein GCM10009422_15280 [Brevundimonas kwangchunensis]|uniref:Carboxypeptidase regulatory-like domain-containing protein n=1 Tax=Brevundimonas kwangchunensis TaxID=322163 RepID=A0ABP3RXT1_9CAUL
MPAAAQTNRTDPTQASVNTPPFGADDLLWMELKAGDVQLTDTMNVYSSRSGVFVPLGEFARLLDLAIGVFPAQRRAEGWVLAPDRQLTVDLNSRTATLPGRRITFTADQAAIYADDLYVRLDLLEQLLPVRLRADTAAQFMELTATEPLPFQQREARARRLAQAGMRPDDAAGVRVATPYRLFSPPAFDVNVGGQLTRDGVNQASRYDIRAAGDLLWAGFEGYVGSNDDGDISDVRVMLSRKDPRGHALGALGGTRAGLGDVFTPSMPIGAAGFGGRGVFYTSAPLENVDLATPLNLRGELALGEEVELYVNEVLQAAQTSPVQGRYEFLDVPLAFGLNTIRLVFYGSQGQTREVVRRINFGAGQVEAGQFRLRLGAVEQGLTVFDVGERSLANSTGEARLVAMAEYGVSSALTLAAGVARFTPEGSEARSVGMLGLRASIGPIAAQLDAARDDVGGQGATLGLAARPFGVSILGRHSEYSGGFIDETRQLGVSSQAALDRASDLRLDGQVGLPGGSGVPVSLNLRRLERVNGERVVNGELRASAPVGRFYASSSVALEDERGGAVSRQRWLGASDVATLVSSRLQLRGGVSYELSPDARLETAYATADWQVSDTNALRFGVIKALGPQGETSLQASNLWRAPRFDLAVNASYETEAQEWRIGLQLGFGLSFDPFDRRYHVTRPGPAAGGAVAVNAWIDENGDGLRQPDEPGVGGIVAETPSGPVTTDADGQALAVGLGDSASARVRLDPGNVDDPFLVAGAPVREFVPRPGGLAVIDYPMQRSAEVELTGRLRRADGSTRALAAMGVELVPENGGAPIAGRSDHAGVIFFEDVRPGVYTVRLDPEQARTLNIRMVTPVQVRVPATGGFVRAGAVEVTFDQEAAR